MDAYWLLKVHNDVDWTDEEALGGEVTREVTLCKDCKHYSPCKNDDDTFFCANFLISNVASDDFCSRGVKRED